MFRILLETAIKKIITNFKKSVGFNYNDIRLCALYGHFESIRYSLPHTINKNYIFLIKK